MIWGVSYRSWMPRRSQVRSLSTKLEKPVPWKATKKTYKNVITNNSEKPFEAESPDGVIPYYGVIFTALASLCLTGLSVNLHT